MLLFLVWIGLLSLGASANFLSWHVVLTPVFENGRPIALKVHHTLALFKTIANLDVGYIADDEVSFYDSQGILDVTARSSTSDDGTQRIWTTHRATIGDLCINYTALPRPTHADAKSGPVLDFRQDGSGLIGAGFGFLALPLVFDQTAIRTTLEWDLSSAPRQISAVSSQGEGSEPIINEGASSMADLQASFFLVGDLKQAFSDPRRPVTSPTFNIYWFVDPPFDVSGLGVVLKDLYSHMRSFFHDSGHPFRMFLRHNARGSLTGTALTNSFTFGWDDTEWTYPRSRYEREAVLAHELTHNWVLLPGAKATENWYSEGLAEYYSVLLRYRAGLISAGQYLEEINEKLTAYYTSPLVQEKLVDVAKLTWNCSHAQRVPYGRGFAFGMLINGLVRTSTSNKHNLDDIVVELAQRLQTAERPDVADYANLLDHFIGNEGRASHEYIEEMEAGMLVVPGDNALEPGVSAHIVRRDVPAFQLGFDERSILVPPYVLQGLIGGSRAQEAGLRNGDLLNMPYTSLYNHVKDTLHAKMVLHVTREDGNRSLQFVVKYWPRTKSLTEAYHYEMDAHQAL